MRRRRCYITVHVHASTHTDKRVGRRQLPRLPVATRASLSIFRRPSISIHPSSDGTGREREDADPLEQFYTKERRMEEKKKNILMNKRKWSRVCVGETWNRSRGLAMMDFLAAPIHSRSIWRIHLKATTTPFASGADPPPSLKTEIKKYQFLSTIDLFHF